MNGWQDNNSWLKPAWLLPSEDESYPAANFVSVSIPVPPVQHAFIAFQGQGGGPLTEAELTRLAQLVRLNQADLTAAQRAEQDALLNRMSQQGIQFSGTNELRILEGIVGIAVSRGGAAGRVLEFLQRGIGVALGGLQDIENAKYVQYRNARWGNAPHDQAWTWLEGGDQARRRFELERLLWEQLGRPVPGWEGRPRVGIPNV